MPRNPLRPSDFAFGALGFLLALLVHNARALILRGAFVWGLVRSVARGGKEKP